MRGAAFVRVFSRSFPGVAPVPGSARLWVLRRRGGQTHLPDRPVRGGSLLFPPLEARHLAARFAFRCRGEGAPCPERGLAGFRSGSPLALRSARKAREMRRGAVGGDFVVEGGDFFSSLILWRRRRRKGSGRAANGCSGEVVTSRACRALGGSRALFSVSVPSKRPSLARRGLA